MNTANLENLLSRAVESDIARAAANATREDPSHVLALVVCGLVVLFAAFAGAAIYARRSPSSRPW